MLFKEYENYNFRFPAPQYLGAKARLLPWIKSHIPIGVKSAIDAFSGSQSVAYLFKQMGIQVTTNDFLSFNHQIGLGLIENTSVFLNHNEALELFRPGTSQDYHLMRDNFTDIFFEEKDAQVLDTFRFNLDQIESSYKRAIGFAVMNRSMTRKVTMGHFAHLKALSYASDPERVKRNRSLTRSIEDIFLDLLPLYNKAVFDNGQRNKSYHSDIIELLPRLKNHDLIYFDPPYCDSHADYQSFYHVLETFTEYWKDKKFVNGVRRYEPLRVSGFDKKADILASFKKMFEQSEDIPHWLISYNDRSYPGIAEFRDMISLYRDVNVEECVYQQSRGGKGSVAGSKEILFVCKPKAKKIHTAKLVANERV